MNCCCNLPWMLHRMDYCRYTWNLIHVFIVHIKDFFVKDLISWIKRFTKWFSTVTVRWRNKILKWIYAYGYFLNWIGKFHNFLWALVRDRVITQNSGNYPCILNFDLSLYLSLFLSLSLSWRTQRSKYMLLFSTCLCKDMQRYFANFCFEIGLEKDLFVRVDFNKKFNTNKLHDRWLETLCNKRIFYHLLIL